jgi:1,4-alpha-glucan branching enzyme
MTERGKTMNKKLYKLMNWPEIEAIVYAEEDNPHRLLGAHSVPGGTLVQFYYPGAVRATVLTEEEAFPMDLADEEGFFAALLPKMTDLSYTVEVTLEDNTKLEITDPYQFDPVITKKDTERFAKGHHYEIYQLLGAHVMEVKGVKGVLFAVWAPNAMRVSVVGDFNDWDGRTHQMRRLWDSGIFELFVPAAKEGDCYKFEICIKGGLTFLKSDPYAFKSQLRPDTASIVADAQKFAWSDDDWISQREKKAAIETPVSIYELYLGSFGRKVPDKEEDAQEGNPYLNYRELAPLVAQYVKEMGYTHIELMPVMEHPYDGSWGYQTIGYYAPTARYGSPDDFKFFMDTMHKNGIGVILDWVPAHFPKDSNGLAEFDGTCLYEHADPRKGVHPHWGTLIFNYGRPEVANYLVANVLYWIREFHADGIRMDAVASMLYLDYGRGPGQWVPNMYGGKENLEAIEMIKQINSLVHKEAKGVLMIAEESTAWPKVTGDIKEDGLGFDLKWNMGWMNDFVEYMRQDPLFRSGHHGELTFSMIYQYSERFVLIFSHDEVVHGKSSMIGKMPGEIEDKYRNLRVAYGYMMMHPGKKLIFMGQDIAEFDEWNENRSVEWDLLKYEDHKNIQNYMKALNAFYKENPALYELDDEAEGFEWINNISANENVIVFLRKTKDQKDTLLVVCNFANEARQEYTVGVPYTGKYKEIFNSDAKEFGGEGLCNKGMISSTEREWDDRDDSITFKMPPLCVQVFSYTPFTKEEQVEIEHRKEAARKRKETLKKLQEAKEAVMQMREAKEEAVRQAEDAIGRAIDMERRAAEARKQAEDLKNKERDLEKLVEAGEKEVARIEKSIEEHDKAEAKRTGKNMPDDKKEPDEKAQASAVSKKTTAKKKTTAAKKTTVTKKAAGTKTATSQKKTEEEKKEQ